MEDSTEKEQTQTESEKPSGSTSTSIVLIKTKAGEVKEKTLVRSAKGTFVSIKKPLTSTQGHIQSGRKRLSQQRNDGKTEMQEMFDSMLELAQYRIGEHEGEKDLAKMSMAKCKAADWVMLHFIGKPAMAEQDSDKLHTMPFSTVYISMPETKPMEEKPAEKTQPSFAEVTDIQTNPKA